jgi:hypothetical protein
VPRRTVWLVTGVVAGAASSLYAERKLRRTLEAAQARIQPDALVVEVGRTARQAASTTGDRVRGAVTAARLEKRRREDELWAELGGSTDGSGAARTDTGDGPAPTRVGAVDDGAAGAPAHAPTRRIRRVARRSPSHLGN